MNYALLIIAVVAALIYLFIGPSDRAIMNARLTELARVTFFVALLAYFLGTLSPV
jgi:hypothetical protein